ncbi:xylulose kinase isoform X2 [Toxorhynchites rutilus septentrionalis]|uniref:xylulose kinase isoform X2 n=1 Tax=Toxorhynchites rutilus septentrionalis TaxID=329112 RepID=UPI0024786D37|nr:xylulose kinase isoform X2 [Toxorhynchites rutilus septentrionalis]
MSELKAVLLNARLENVAHAEVKFDSDLPEFRTSGGVNAGAAKNEFYVQPVMWVKALDMVLDRLVVQGGDLSTVMAVSGSAQQHGSLYWSRNGVHTLQHLDADKFLHTQIDDSAFTVHRTPIWMDSTTVKQCEAMEETVGGREKMVAITGSKCYERFTGPQIRKVYQQRPDCYRNTERISLVSSFLASIFLGEVAPIDFSDGSGMNLLDIRKRAWSEVCLTACAPNLESKLGMAVPTNSVIGKIGQFFVQRYNFNTACKVVAFTGDNLSALAGMTIGDNWLALSLGTSDTIMMKLNEPPNLQEGHVMVHPTDDGYMGLLCFRNGSLVRDIFKRAEANDNWENFSELLDSTPRGNFGNIALHFISKEIIPPIKGSLRWNKSSNLDDPEAARGVLKYSSPQNEIRALVEGQMLTRKAYATEMGFSFGENTRILATGGASANKSILQVASDVFNAPVYTQKTTEAALLGAAYRAKYVLELTRAKERGSSKTLDSYYEYIRKLLPEHSTVRVCDPSQDSSDIYGQMLERHHQMVQYMTDHQD